MAADANDNFLGNIGKALKEGAEKTTVDAIDFFRGKFKKILVGSGDQPGGNNTTTQVEQGKKGSGTMLNIGLGLTDQTRNFIIGIVAITAAYYLFKKMK